MIPANVYHAARLTVGQLGNLQARVVLVLVRRSNAAYLAVLEGELELGEKLIFIQLVQSRLKGQILQLLQLLLVITLLAAIFLFLLFLGAISVNLYLLLSSSLLFSLSFCFLSIFLSTSRCLLSIIV